MQETPVRFLGQEDPLEKGKATHSSILELPLCFPCGSAGKESTRNAGDLGWEDPLEKGTATHSSILVSGLENSMAHSSWGHEESDTTERLHFLSHFHY